MSYVVLRNVPKAALHFKAHATAFFALTAAAFPASAGREVTVLEGLDIDTFLSPIRDTSSVGNDVIQRLTNLVKIEQLWNSVMTCGLVVQDDVEQRTVDLQSAVVLDESQFSEAVHEETDARASSPHHFGERDAVRDGSNHLRSVFDWLSGESHCSDDGR